MIYFLSMPKKYAILHHWSSCVHQSVAEYIKLIQRDFCELELVGHLGLSLQFLQFALLLQVLSSSLPSIRSIRRSYIFAETQQNAGLLWLRIATASHKTLLTTSIRFFFRSDTLATKHEWIILFVSQIFKQQSHNNQLKHLLLVNFF